MSRMTGLLSIKEIDQMVAGGSIDTVIVAFTDLQGRLMGKRVTGNFFVDHVIQDGIEACNYLLALDVDMTPLDGYEYANWDKGYGDFSGQPDLSTLRLIPWLEKTALVLCDLFDVKSGEPVEVSPRRILQRQIEKAAEAGFQIKCGSELEFYLFQDSYRDARNQNYQYLEYHSGYNEDYHILQTTRDEYIIRAIRNGIGGAGIPVEFSKGEAGAGQHEINIRYADALAMADNHVIYKNGAKEIADLNDRSITFMAKYDMDQSGSSCHIHSSIWSLDGKTSLMHDSEGLENMSKEFRGWLGGQLAHARELAWMYAPTVNSYKRYQSESWAPTAIAWGTDNRTCGFRVVGHDGASHRVENRLPGADCNPYLAFAATIAAGLSGIRAQTDPGPAFNGNAYSTDKNNLDTKTRIPSDIVSAIECFSTSTLAKESFGELVHGHLLNTARQEWAAFGGVITDWERRRCFEQF